jgi:hypothetical protein
VRRLFVGLAIAGVAGGVSLLGPTATAEGYADRVAVKPTRLYVKDERGRVVVSVTNNSGETLDVDVGCTFFMGTAKVGSGTGSVSRLPPRRTDTVEIADRQTLPLDSVGCDVSRAEK